MTKKRIEPVDKEVGARVRARRHAIGISQTDLGEAVGTTFQQIQKYEKGVNRISSSRLQQIANALEVAPYFFFEGAAAPARPEESLAAINQFRNSSEGARLARAFSRIESKIVRSAIVRLVEALDDSN